MLKKGLFFSAIALTSIAFLNTSFAYKPTSIPCPTKKMIRSAADQAEFYIIDPGTKWKEYAVASKNAAFEVDGQAWSVVSYIHGNNSEEALKRGKNNLKKVSLRLHSFAEVKQGPYAMCSYVGEKGMIVATTKIR